MQAIRVAVDVVITGYMQLHCCFCRQETHIGNDFHFGPGGQMRAKRRANRHMVPSFNGRCDYEQYPLPLDVTVEYDAVHGVHLVDAQHAAMRCDFLDRLHSPNSQKSSLRISVRIVLVIVGPRHAAFAQLFAAMRE